MSPFAPIARRSLAVFRSEPWFAPARLPHCRRLLNLWLGLERLEDRTVLSSFNLPVTSLADSGPGTLRSAITNADFGNAAHTYNIEFKVSGTITLESALPDLNRNMNLSGPGAGRLTVERDRNASSDFSIFLVDQGVTVGITGITIANGITSDSGSGGGINNNGKLTVSRATISGNTAYDGGGIYNNGTLTLSHSSMSSNLAGHFGGGIDNTGELNVSYTTISYNPGFGTVPISDIPLDGGGIYNSNTGTITASHSTIFGNWARDGGGISNNGNLTVSHTTISGNLADDGGGIYNNGNLTASHTTMSGNQTGAYGGGIYNNGKLAISHTTISSTSAPDDGGGIYNNGTLTLSHSSIFRNLAGHFGGAIDNTGTLTVSYSSISDNQAYSFGGGVDNTGTLIANHTTISDNLSLIALGVYNSGGGQAEIDDSTIVELGAGGAIVNNATGIANIGSTVHVKKTEVNGVLHNGEYDS
ncbi:MAG: hypothetical protein ACLQIB_56500 [Isosphaeraceae bacterium]